MPAKRNLAPLATILACKRDFIHGVHRSIRTAALAHGLNPHTIRDRSDREGWQALRRDYLYQQDQKILKGCQPEPPPPPQTSSQSPASALAILDEQIDQLNQLFKSETDPAALDKLQSALSKASERRRILLNIPLPGSHRPSRKPARPVFDFGEPVIDDPPPSPALPG